MQNDLFTKSILGNGSRPMNTLNDLFMSPEWYPLEMDLERRSVTFVRMSQKAYRRSVFHATHAARRFGTDAFTVRLDDVLFGASSAARAARRAHFILHCAFCCSTLLARYLELLPASVVLKEPQWLTQLALARNNSVAGWSELFDLSVHLLTRTYEPDEIAIIKTNIPCNRFGERFLERNGQATVTFLMTPIRDFLLAALKSDFRHSRVRWWNRDLRESNAAWPRSLAAVDCEKLTIEQAAAFFWLQTRVLCSELAAGPHGSRVLVLNGQRIAESPQEVLPAVAAMCGRTLNHEQLRWLVDHPTSRQYSKNTSRPFDANSRHQELEDLEKRHGKQADAAVDWAMSLGLDADWLNVPETDAITCTV